MQRSPEELRDDPRLSREQKIERLRRLGYDVRLRLVASEEGMTGRGDGEPAALLARVQDALRALGAEEDPGGGTATKQGS